MKQSLFGVVIAVALSCLQAEAEVLQTPAFDGIMLSGRSEAVVSAASVTLGDLVDITTPRIEDGHRTEELRKIVVAASPKPGETMRLDGAQVVEGLSRAGIDLNAIRYSLPREMTVKRTFREVSLDDVERALSDFLVRNPKQIDVKKIALEKGLRIPSDSSGLEVVALDTTKPGHIAIDYRSVPGSDETRFRLKASAESWRMLPVAARPLKKGDVLKAEDIKFSKVTDATSNGDALENLGDILGRQVTRDLGQGELFRVKSISVPAVVHAGSAVTLVVKNASLEVTASGTAVEAGAVGQEIKVRNNASSKVVSGRVQGPAVVIVEAY